MCKAAVTAVCNCSTNCLFADDGLFSHYCLIEFEMTTTDRNVNDSVLKDTGIDFECLVQVSLCFLECAYSCASDR